MSGFIIHAAGTMGYEYERKTAFPLLISYLFYICHTFMFQVKQVVILQEHNSSKYKMQIFFF